LTLPNENREDIKVQVCDVNDSIKNLGLAIGIKKFSRMKFNNKITMKTRESNERIKES
jgi:hypothetical protein